MLTKHKIWLGAGVLAMAVGAIVGRAPAFRATVWPARSGALNPEGSAEEGESGESGEASPTAEAGEAGRGSATEANAADESGEAGEHGAVPTSSSVQDFAGGSFDTALAKVLGGEGGKGGLGITPLYYNGGQWSFTVPALTGAQTHKAVAGNSLRSERHFALHFAPDGHYGGWSFTWAKAASLARCPSKSGETWGVFDGECWVATENPLAGTWTVKGDTLCFAPPARGVTDGRDCVRTALMLGSLVMFGPDGKMIGKGAELLPGNNAGRSRVR
ncbi:MAG: hypothetical protein WA747_06975 [Steroidobacteraceae bacterium]